MYITIIRRDGAMLGRQGKSVGETVVCCVEETGAVCKADGRNIGKRD